MRTSSASRVDSEVGTQTCSVAINRRRGNTLDCSSTGQGQYHVNKFITHGTGRQSSVACPLCAAWRLASTLVALANYPRRNTCRHIICANKSLPTTTIRTLDNLAAISQMRCISSRVCSGLIIISQLKVPRFPGPWHFRLGPLQGPRVCAPNWTWSIRRCSFAC